MSEKLLTLTLYTRSGCHLCEDMMQELEQLQPHYRFSINVVDIDTDSYLQLRYGDKIPVLAAGEQELCHYHFNKEMVLKYLS